MFTQSEISLLLFLLSMSCLGMHVIARAAARKITKVVENTTAKGAAIGTAKVVGGTVGKLIWQSYKKRIGL